MPDERLSVAQVQQAITESGAGWEAGETPLSALSEDEVVLWLGYVPGPDEEPLEAREAAAVANLEAARAAVAAVGAPASFDWRNVGGGNYVTAVKSQGGCGSCVAFGTIATVEATLRKQLNNPSVDVNYSEAHLFYCHAAAQGRNCDGPPNGGWSVAPALDCFKNIGVVDDACFPYTGGDQACNLCADWQSRLTKIKGWHKITSLTEMKDWLSTRGPLVTCFSVYQDFRSYKTGVYSHVSGAWEGGHCVSCVGYDDAGGYWICKNSWGTNFGESGYFRIAYGQVGIDASMWAIDGVQETVTGTAYSGVWRGGTDPYYLWANAPQANFITKWQELSGQNLRLVDLETYTVGGSPVWTGVWRGGSDGHYLWLNADWNNFVAKWNELGPQNLRLTVIKAYPSGGKTLYAGVWRAGTDGYYLWANANTENFLAKWNELNAHNLRLVDIQTYTLGGQQVWAGVWRGGSDAHYLWINADWNSFVTKWQQLGQQNLRLTALTTYLSGGTRLFSGVWRAGSDPYYLWVGASWDNFVAKWKELGPQGLRLIELETWPDASKLRAETGAAAEPGAGMGGGSADGAAGTGEGGGSDAAAAGAAGTGEGGGSELGAGIGGGSELGTGEGGGSELGAGAIGAGEGGGSAAAAGAIGTGEGGGSV